MMMVLQTCVCVDVMEISVVQEGARLTEEGAFGDGPDGREAPLSTNQLPHSFIE